MSSTQEKQRAKIADVLMTPNQAWRGMKSVPIELIWGIEQLIDSAKREELIKIHTFHEGRFMTIEDRIAQLEQSEESI